MSRAFGRRHHAPLTFLKTCAPYAALGLVVTQISIAALGVAAGQALATGVRVALGAWLVRTVLQVIRPAGAGLAERGNLPSWGAIVAATLALLVAALQRAPSRLLINLLGYGVLALPVLWLAQRRGGQLGTARAALAVGAFVLLPTHMDWRSLPGPELYGQETAYLWSVGWPTPDWALRHEVIVPPERHGRRMELVAVLAERYAGAGRIVVTANGQELGPADLVADGHSVRSLVPGTLVRGGEALSVELRLAPYDPRLRVVAHRWTAGASRGAAASAYFDAQRWQPGTFAAATGRPQPGAYLLMLNALP